MDMCTSQKDHRCVRGYRDTLGVIISVLTITMLLWSCKANKATTDKGDQRPNIVFIIADDMSWDDSGAYGHPHIHTPHIDQLAVDGMRFDEAYLTASSCSPSRASIITGLYPHNTNAEQLHWPLTRDKTTFVEILRQSGYWTAQAGKWHLGEAVKDRFDRIYPVGTSGFQLTPDGKKAVQEGDGSGCEDWVTLLVERPRDRPFFAWLAAVDPHRPYTSETTPAVHDARDVVLPPYFPDTEEVREDFIQYYDEISRLDGYVGRVVAELDRQGISDNTLVLFISDNGRPFPRDKTTLYDGGIKTPWIVKWPKIVPPHSNCQQLVSAIDIAPTFLSIAGLSPLSVFEGVDFSNLLTRPDREVRDMVFAEDHWHDYEDYSRAIRTKEYKYIRNFYPDLPNTPSADAFRSLTFSEMRRLYAQGKLDKYQEACFISPRPAEELYNVVGDPYELENIADSPQYAEVVKKLRSAMDQIRNKTGDSLPSFRTPDEFDRSTGQPNSFRQRPRPDKEAMRKIILEMKNN